MELSLKPDLSQAQRAWAAFWRGELRRPILQIIVPSPNHKGIRHPYPMRPDRDPVAQAEQALACARDYEYLGDAIPSVMMEFAPEQFATFLGAKLHFDPVHPGTGWVLPFVDNWGDVDIALQRGSEGWCKTLEFIRTFRKTCDGHMLVNAPVLSAGLDCLAAIRDPEKLLVDLLDHPQKVHHALAGVRRAYNQVVEQLAVELAWGERGSCNWNNMYHPRRVNAIQCDFSCMISADMFREFQVPCLIEEAGHYDAVAYHLDGPQAAHHLPALCQIEKLDIIQYVPVPSESPEHIERVYEQTLSLGKGIIRSVSLPQAMDIWRRWPDRKLIFSMWLPTRNEAQAVLDAFGDAVSGGES